MPPIEVTSPGRLRPETHIVKPGREARFTLETTKNTLMLIAIRCSESDKGGAVFTKPLNDTSEVLEEIQSYSPDEGGALHAIVFNGGTTTLSTGEGDFVITHIPGPDIDQP